MVKRAEIIRIDLDYPIKYDKDRYEENESFYLEKFSKSLFPIDESEEDEKELENDIDYEYSGIEKWESDKYKFSTKIKLTTTNGEISIPLRILFKTISDKDLLITLALINDLNPIVEYEFYEVGEKFGYSDSTIVKKNDTIIKSFKLQNKNEQLLEIHKYIREITKNASDADLKKLSLDYMNQIEEERLEIEMAEYEEMQSKLDYEAEKKSLGFNDEYYNDQLDMDQQSPEFWDTQ
ncbi:hypothetical protein NE848_17275 [Gramella jeungdoensis]|uniref:Uncharacterized protein n=1 Tax=Gramella jeungdoensis TaxID=708091 RepID=A0ABT0Z5Y3_9FLAO|nr:hypothetical protein [Gramella jeungdoensis]MCM8571147.1 hypothetical protein [Gramella jeungdoensis]